MKNVFFALAVVLSSGCAVVQRIDSAIDCNGICERYKACFDQAYDVDTCTSRCRESAASDADFRRRADTCMACITERSCMGATFACAGQCVSVVP